MTENEEESAVTMPDFTVDEPMAGVAPPMPEPPVGGTKDGVVNYETILKIPVTVQVVLGSTTMPVANLMKLGRGAVVALDQRVGEPVNVVVNGRIVARGEVVVVDEASSRFGVSLTEIVASSGAEKAA
jgi:flagellar motor switch protein FliN/FliY